MAVQAGCCDAGRLRGLRLELDINSVDLCNSEKPNLDWVVCRLVVLMPQVEINLVLLSRYDMRTSWAIWVRRWIFDQS
jgi:hypothetical protein